jgi:hypothetical protein
MPDDLKNLPQLQQLLKKAVEYDQNLRAKYEVGEKFRFVKDKLYNFLSEVEKNLEGVNLAHATKTAKTEVGAEEAVVYVYLFNAQGLILQSWRHMLTAKLLYEYSINRPIYSIKNDVVSLIRSKQNKAQHGFITIKINRSDVVTGGLPITDSLGNSVIKVREGSLRFDKLLSFTHNEIDYRVSEEGDITKISDEL